MSPNCPSCQKSPNFQTYRPPRKFPSCPTNQMFQNYQTNLTSPNCPTNQMFRCPKSQTNQMFQNSLNFPMFRQYQMSLMFRQSQKFQIQQTIPSNQSELGLQHLTQDHWVKYKCIRNHYTQRSR